MNTGGDDLDDYVLDDEYLAASDDDLEGSAGEVGDSPSTEEQAGPSVDDSAARQAKKRKQKEKTKERKAKVSHNYLFI